MKTMRKSRTWKLLERLCPDTVAEIWADGHETGFQDGEEQAILNRPIPETEDYPWGDSVNRGNVLSLWSGNA